MRDGYTGWWGVAIVWDLNAVCLVLDSVIILEVMVVMGLTP